MRKRKGPSLFFQILTVVLSFFSVFLPCGYRWALVQFAEPKMDEIVFELSAPLEGTGNGLIKGFILQCILPGLIWALIVFGIMRALRKSKWYPIIVRSIFAIFLAISVGTLSAFIYKIEFVNWLINKFSLSDYIEDNYVNPDLVSCTFPDDKRNLIFIYLESMETTFSDVDQGGAFERDHIPELTELAQEYEDFSGNDPQLNGGHVMPGTSWTMGAMFGTSSGLPLKLQISNNAMSAQASFFPEITCLGDILRNAGYRQAIMMGSDASFGGRKLFYTEHGGYEISDYPWAKEEGLIPDDYKEFWGYEDEKLFTYAKDKLLELGEGGGEPFNFTLLTVDTHTPAGYACRLCEDEFDTQYENALACSSRQVAEFVHWIQNQNFYDNTTIVITGDHQTMAPGVCDDISEEYERKTYTCIINSSVEPELKEKSRIFTTLDLFPTVLASLGCTIEGNRLGLGTNLYSSEETLAERDGYVEVAKTLEKRSLFLESLEKLDDDVLLTVEELKDYAAPTYKLNLETKKIAFYALSGYGEYSSDDIKKASVLLWYYDDNMTYISKTINLSKRDNGTWKGKGSISKFTGTSEANCQLYLTIKGKGMVKVGKEGTVLFDWAQEEQSQ